MGICPSGFFICKQSVGQSVITQFGLFIFKLCLPLLKKNSVGAHVYSFIECKQLFTLIIILEQMLFTRHPFFCSVVFSILYNFYFLTTKMMVHQNHLIGLNSKIIAI